MSHTYAVLEISGTAWREIKQKLIEAEYQHAFHDDVIDMHGLAVKAEEPTRTRVGDQPLPIPNKLPNMQDMVISDIETRKDLGLKRYGTLLQPHNGRDFLLDAYQESLDQTLYLRGAIFERDGK